MLINKILMVLNKANDSTMLQGNIHVEVFDCNVQIANFLFIFLALSV